MRILGTFTSRAVPISPENQAFSPLGKCRRTAPSLAIAARWVPILSGWRMRAKLMTKAPFEEFLRSASLRRGLRSQALKD